MEDLDEQSLFTVRLVCQTWYDAAELVTTEPLRKFFSNGFTFKDNPHHFIYRSSHLPLPPAAGERDPTSTEEPVEPSGDGIWAHFDSPLDRRFFLRCDWRWGTLNEEGKVLFEPLKSTSASDTQFVPMWNNVGVMLKLNAKGKCPGAAAWILFFGKREAFHYEERINLFTLTVKKFDHIQCFTSKWRFRQSVGLAMNISTELRMKLLQEDGNWILENLELSLKVPISSSPLRTVYVTYPSTSWERRNRRIRPTNLQYLNSSDKE
jgi:hypothetical protein